MPSQSRKSDDAEASAPLLGTSSSPTSPVRPRSHERSAHITLPISSITRESSASLLPQTGTERPTWSDWWGQFKSSAFGKWMIGLGTAFLIVLVGALGYAAWRAAGPPPPPPPPGPPGPPGHPPPFPPGPPSKHLCLTPACVSLAAKLIESVNTTQDPCDNFYQHVCGNWEETHDLPEDRGRIGVFNDLAEKNTQVVRRILEGHLFPSEEELQDPIDTVLLGQLRQAYNTCMSEPLINELGPHPLYALVGQFNQTLKEPSLDLMAFQRALEELQSKNIDVFFSMMIEAHPDEPERQVVYLAQPDLSLPSRSYYNDTEYLTILASTIQTVFETLFPLGPTSLFAEASNHVFEPDTDSSSSFFGRHPSLTWEKIAQAIVELETELAKISWDTEDLQDPIKTKNPMTLTQLESLFNLVSWTTFFKDVASRFQLTDCPRCFSSVIVMTPSYFQSLGSVLNSTSISTLNYYFTWRIMYELIGHVDEPTRQLLQPFKAKVYGLTKPFPRFEMCVRWLDQSMGMAMGRFYVLKQFVGESKQRAQDMVMSILHRFQTRLDSNPWMDTTTKLKAKEKVQQMTLKIGYPNYLLNTTHLSNMYQDVNVTSPHHFDHAVMFREHQVRLTLMKLKAPTNKDEWEMLPHTVNAYYNPSQNEIVFPAGILQPPFFHVDFPDTMNLGAIGSVIGHEILHGFDNHGRLYDPVGKLQDWWTPSTAQAFKTKTQCFIDQYSDFYILDPHRNPVYVNGKLTLGENLADNGGLQQSFDTWSYSTSNNLVMLPGLPYTPQQLFFLSFAHVWCGKMRPQYALQAIRTDPHSPNFVRVNAAVQNSNAFSNAFECPSGAPMRSSHPCKMF